VNRHLTTASNAFEADIILSRLAEAGIHAWTQNEAGVGGGLAGPGMVGHVDIYVDEPDLEAAKRVLVAAQSVSEDELIALSEGKTPQAKPAEGDSR